MFTGVEEGVIDPKVSIVIVNWNGRKYLDRCLTSVFAQYYSNYEIVFVDNGSSDGSAEYVEIEFPQAKIIRLDKNYGFAKGNNVGMEEAFKDPLVKYIAVLNNDTEVHPRWLQELVNVAEAHKQLGSVAPKILFYYDRSMICCVGISVYRDGGAMEKGRLEDDCSQYDMEEEVFGPTAASALYRREMLEEVGFFDEDYFVYYEDVDLAWRARLAGWTCLYVPTSIVYHILAATSERFPTMKAYYMERNRLWNVAKLFPTNLVISAIWYSVLRYSILAYGIMAGRGAAARFLTRESPRTMINAVIRAHVDTFRALPVLLAKRREIQSLKKVSNSEISSWFRRFGVRANDLVS